MALQIIQPIVQTYQYETIWQLYGESLGKGSAPNEWDRGVRYIPYSIAYCCRVCGKIWARIAVEHQDSEWVFEQRRCPEHGWGYLLNYDVEDSRMLDIPYNVLVRELLLALRYIDPSIETHYEIQLLLDGK